MWWIVNSAAAFGPLLVLGGVCFGMPVAFTVGTALCCFNEFLAIAAGARSTPVMAVIFAVTGECLVAPWFTGAGLGLACWTAITFFRNFATRQTSVWWRLSELV
ncbi:hypothetical protein M5E06_30805 [Azospirillum sp. A1-3]|uniref:hypothetical protein n=1 Tax=Azospirillum sp. A1-3 TaxID=185874 RepID=UPI002076F135|nr:hypothetical protein [Azospirillum sp. A1-3]MCM8738520.1 hypothetical protein [Azospirillum sp. A1-3]